MSEAKEIADGGSVQEEINPWIDIWLRPRKTIEWIVNNHPSIVTSLVLIYLGGVYFGIRQSEIKHYGDWKETQAILTSAILVSGLGGLIAYNILIWSIDFCALWFGGKGNFKKTQAAFAWSAVPSIAGIILTVLGYILFENELFTSETPMISGSIFLKISFWTYGILKLILGIWHVILFVVTISAVQRLSILRSILSLLTGAFLIMLPIFGIAILVMRR